MDLNITINNDWYTKNTDILQNLSIDSNQFYVPKFVKKKIL